MQTETHSGVAPLIDKSARQMKFIDMAHRVASFRLGELTSRHMETFFQSFKNVPLSSLTALYDAEDDVIILNRDHSDYETFKDLTLSYLNAAESQRQHFRESLESPAVIEICDLVDSVTVRRKVKKQLLILENLEGHDLDEDVIYALRKKYGDPDLGNLFWLDRIYQYGIAHGKRLERARRKGAQA